MLSGETGFAISPVSLLGGFNSAVDGFHFLSDVYASFDDQIVYAAKLEIEQHRLQTWGEFFGFDDACECERLLEQPEVVQSLVLYIFKEFEDATKNLDKMHAKYGLKMVHLYAQEPHNDFMSSTLKCELLDNLAEMQSQHTSRLKWWKKGLPWALDLPRFEKLLDHLEYLNDSLERTVPRPELSLLTQGVASSLVSGQDHLSYLKTYQNASQPLVALCSAARRIKLNTRLLKDVPTVKWDDLKFGSPFYKRRDGSAVGVASLKGHQGLGPLQEVLIDWTETNEFLTLDYYQESVKRIKSMCLMFRKVSEDPLGNFRILPCLGLIEDPVYSRQRPGFKKHGFVFKSPAEGPTNPESLYQSFEKTSNVPIGDRFKLAQNLASSLLLLHSSKWVHKNLCSENIILFKDKDQNQHDTSYITSPYLLGFSYARPDAPSEPSMEGPVPDEVDVYRHPDFELSHTVYNDIYSLGVVLFEIGYWESVATISSYHKRGFKSEAEVLSSLERHCAPGKGLPSRMGTTYADVVRRCLTGDFGVLREPGDDGALIQAFWSLVVGELDSCRA